MLQSDEYLPWMLKHWPEVANLPHVATRAWCPAELAKAEQRTMVPATRVLVVCVCVCVYGVDANQTSTFVHNAFVCMCVYIYCMRGLL